MIIKIALVALFPSPKFPFIGESHGICVISGYLKKKFKDEVKIELYDQQIHTNDEIIKRIIAFTPDIIGFSVKIGTLPELDKVTSQIELNYSYLNKSLPIFVFGNSIAHFNHEYLLKKYPNSMVSFGEGEVSFGDLILFLKNRLNNRRSIRNVAFVEDESIVKSKFEYLPSSEIAKADRSNSLEFYQKGGEVYIEGSRGCNYCGCSICECRLFLGSKNAQSRWRHKNVDKILEELKILKSIGIDKVTFSDEDFWGYDDVDSNHAYAIATGIIQSGIKIQYRINLRVKSIYSCNYSTRKLQEIKKILSILKYSGLSKVFLGFESGSPTQLKRYGKGFSLDEFIHAKNILDDLRIEYELGYISFDPLMSLDELYDSLKFIKENNCIPYISNIFKELRIQKGNDSYLNQVHKYETLNRCKIIDKLDLNEQVYPILRYADDRIEFLVSLMRDYEKGMYKLYYYMRIITQYSKEESVDLERMVHDCMAELKDLDFTLAMKCCQLMRERFSKNYILREYNKALLSRDELLKKFSERLLAENSNLSNNIYGLYCKYKSTVSH